MPSGPAVLRFLDMGLALLFHEDLFFLRTLEFICTLVVIISHEMLAIKFIVSYSVTMRIISLQF
jgi:hypothetical protein